MWNLRNTLTPLLFVLLVIGCTTEEPVVPALPDAPESAAGAQPVCFSLCESSATPVATRAQSPLPAGETVRVLVYLTGAMSAASFVAENTYLVDPNRGGRLTPCTVDETGMVTGLGEELFLLPGRSYDIHAYSPALPSADHQTVTGIGHGTDLLGSKLTLILQKFTPDITLEPLVHQCALMDFTIQADPADPSVLDLSAESVRLTSMSRTPGSYTLGSATGVSPNGTTRDATVQIEAFNKLTDTQISASQVVLPKAAGNFTLELDVLINGTKYSLSAPVNNLALQTKTKYSWVVTCQRQGITLSFSVSPWQNDTFNSKVGIPAPLQEPANSFMVTPGRGISFKAVRADGSTLTGITKAEVLWQTRDNGAPVIEHPSHVVWDSENQRILVYTNATTNGGKAVVVARNASNAEVHRWLVWITPYSPSGALNGEIKGDNQAIVVGEYPDGSQMVAHIYDRNFKLANGPQAVIMDRNLGAYAPAYYVRADAGCYFQQGSRIAYADSKEILYRADGVTRYTQPVAPNTVPVTTWTPVSISGNTATGVKSVDDPCPYGWRVPVHDRLYRTWAAFDSNSCIFEGDGLVYGSTFGYPFDAFYPYTGGDNTQFGCWGANRMSDINVGYVFRYGEGGLLTLTTQESAANLYSVRCVQDAVVYPVGAPKMDPVTISNISATAATFNCRMASTGGATIEERGFYYDTRPFVDGAGAKSVMALEAPNDPLFSGRVTMLTQGSTYYVQAYIKTDKGTFYSTPLVQFVPTGLPKVSTLAATSTAPTTATVNASVDDSGGSSISKRGVVYSTISNFDPENQGTQVAAGTVGIGNYVVPLTGLQQGTTYFVRAYASNQTATAYGMQRSFTTVGVPTFTDPTVSNVTGTTATFRSALIGPLPTPGVTQWGFEWSRDANFPAGAQTTTLPVNTPPYNTGKAFTLNATGLAENSVYYVRAYGINAAGKGYSQAVRFVTLKLPLVYTGPVTGVNYIGADGKVPATFYGKVNHWGDQSSIDRGFEYSTVASFVGGTGTKLSAGKGDSSPGEFATPTNIIDGTTYYVRAYATTIAGTVYGDIQQARLDYVKPTFTGVTMTIVDRRINTLQARQSGIPQLGNARSIEQGYAYQEEGTSNYIYSSDGRPRLKVYKKYTVYSYVKNAKGIYYSEANAIETTYSNYVTYKGREYVIDKKWEEGNEAWTTGLMSLLLLNLQGFETDSDGYGMTQWLVNYNDWSIHPKAAKYCWEKPLKNGVNWFLGARDFSNAIFTDIATKPSVYDASIMVDKGERYWTSQEAASMTAYYSYWNPFSNKFTVLPVGKNYKRAVRCVRYRTWLDEYAD